MRRTAIWVCTLGVLGLSLLSNATAQDEKATLEQRVVTLESSVAKLTARVTQLEGASGGASAEAPGKKPAAATGGFPVTMTLANKQYSPTNIQKRQLKDYINLKFDIRNGGAKDIRAFHVVVEFYDLFGEIQKRIAIKHTEAVKGNGAGAWEGSVEYSQFKDDDRWLRATETKDIVLKVVPVSIIYADGTTQKFE